MRQGFTRTRIFCLLGQGEKMETQEGKRRVDRFTREILWLRSKCPTTKKAPQTLQLEHTHHPHLHQVCTQRDEKREKKKSPHRSNVYLSIPRGLRHLTCIGLVSDDSWIPSFVPLNFYWSTQFMSYVVLYKGIAPDPSIQFEYHLGSTVRQMYETLFPPFSVVTSVANWIYQLFLLIKYYIIWYKFSNWETIQDTNENSHKAQVLR